MHKPITTEAEITDKIIRRKIIPGPCAEGSRVILTRKPSSVAGCYAYAGGYAVYVSCLGRKRITEQRSFDTLDQAETFYNDQADL